MRTMTLEHVAIWTANLDRLKNYYEQYFNASSNEIYTNPATGFSSYFLRFEFVVAITGFSRPS